MKIAIYINTENPEDLETAERVIDVIKRGEDYKAWLKKLEKEQEVKE